MILIPSAALMVTPMTPKPSEPVLSAQTALAEAFVRADWGLIERGFADNVQVWVYNRKGKHEQKVTGKPEGIALLSNFRPTVGITAVKSCEFNQLKVGSSVVCFYTWDDKTIRDFLTVTTIKDGRISEFFVGMNKK